MSLRVLVAELVREMGSATVDELTERVDGYTRTQVGKALHNATLVKLVHCIRAPRRGGPRYGSNPARYYPGPIEDANYPAPVASVWELGERPSRRWPPAGAGRQCQPLGDWPEYQPREAA